MAEVMIRCPNTGEAVRTGINVPYEVLQQIEMRGNSVQCGSCGETHVWDGEDAFPDS